MSSRGSRLSPKLTRFDSGLMVKPLTPTVKPWMIKSLITFDSMDRTVQCDYSLDSC